MLEAKLVVHIHSYWHAGTGRGRGGLVHALVRKDHRGLPYLPGRSLKGLLRDAVLRATTWGHLDKDRLEGWFGSDPETARGKPLETQPGALAVGDACLPKQDAAYLSSRPGKILRPLLFRHLQVTAMDERTGAAKDGALRTMEVTLPLRLEANLGESLPGKLEPFPNWVAELRPCLALIRAVGGDRNRGLGRATLKLEERS